MASSSSVLITFFLALAYAPHFLTCTSQQQQQHHRRHRHYISPSRRILHQPFFPQDSFPPSQPPSPSPPAQPKIPFSGGTASAPNTNSPFFPTYPSSPPPPSPVAFASFPANISSLILPQSPKQSKPASQKPLVVAISAVLSACLILGVIIFYHRRRRGAAKQISDDNKTYRSDNSNRLYPAEARRSSSNKLRTANSTSSEFLYLGTLVNSRSINESSNDNVGSDPRKLESPELHPLPPLSRQQTLRQNAEVGSTTTADDDDDDHQEEFYSPRGSLGGGNESSIGTGSGSRRVLAAVGGGAADFEGGITDSSLYSSSSSASGSPARSPLLIISPPVSLSPRPKSPESSTEQAASPPPQPQLFSPQLRPMASPSLSATSPDESPRISFNLDHSRQVNSLSSASDSPARTLEKSAGGSPLIINGKDRNFGSPLLSPARVSNGLDGNIRSPTLSTANVSPNRGVMEKSPPRISHDLDQNVCCSSPSFSSASASPDGATEGNPSPRISNDFHQNVRSHSLFSASTSPEMGLEKNPLLVSPRISNVSDQKSVSSVCSSPYRCLRKSPDGSPSVALSVSGLNAKISSVLQQPISVAPPPPPPPPPLPPPPRQWESPILTTPTGQQISKPPVLIPPSRPFVLQSATVVSPMELPQSSGAMENVEEIPKPKLKPLHWDKVRASSDREMVWDQMRSSSFKLNEEMIETLFVVNNPTSKPKQTTPRSIIPSINQENRVLDPKKAQNIAILLRALNVTIEEVCEALLEGNADTLGTELLESLLKMAPTKEEERKLNDYKDDSPIKLGHAEKFLKSVLDVPFAFKRVEAMLYITNFDSEVEYLKKSFETLEAACEELRNSRMFLKLLEAVLKTGNRMNVGTNRGDAHAFKLDTLLKLVDVKGADGKTTLLHFVVQEIIRTEGVRLSGTSQTLNSNSNEDAKCRKLGLQVVAGLSSELANVKKAAAMDSDVLGSDVSKLSRGIDNITEVVQLNERMGSDESTQKFSESMQRFMKMAEEEIFRIQAHESVALSLVKEITEYFHGNSAREEAHPFRIFMVVRDFLNVLDRVCKEVGMINERTIVSSAHKFPVPVNPTLPQAFSAFNSRRQYSSTDDESASPQ